MNINGLEMLFGTPALLKIYNVGKTWGHLDALCAKLARHGELYRDMLTALKKEIVGRSRAENDTDLVAAGTKEARDAWEDYLAERDPSRAASRSVGPQTAADVTEYGPGYADADIAADKMKLFALGLQIRAAEKNYLTAITRNQVIHKLVVARKTRPYSYEDVESVWDFATVYVTMQTGAHSALYEKMAVRNSLDETCFISFATAVVNNQALDD